MAPVWLRALARRLAGRWEAACETAGLGGGFGGGGGGTVAKRVQPIPDKSRSGLSLRYEEYRKIYPALRTGQPLAGGGQ